MLWYKKEGVRKLNVPSGQLVDLGHKLGGTVKKGNSLCLKYVKMKLQKIPLNKD